MVDGLEMVAYHHRSEWPPVLFSARPASQLHQSFDVLGHEHGCWTRRRRSVAALQYALALATGGGNDLMQLSSTMRTLGCSGGGNQRRTVEQPTLANTRPDSQLYLAVRLLDFASGSATWRRRRWFVVAGGDADADADAPGTNRGSALMVDSEFWESMRVHGKQNDGFLLPGHKGDSPSWQTHQPVRARGEGHAHCTWRRNSKAEPSWKATLAGSCKQYRRKLTFEAAGSRIARLSGEGEIDITHDRDQGYGALRAAANQRSYLAGGEATARTCLGDSFGDDMPLVRPERRGGITVRHLPEQDGVTRGPAWGVRTRGEFTANGVHACEPSGHRAHAGRSRGERLTRRNWPCGRGDTRGDRGISRGALHTAYRGDISIARKWPRLSRRPCMPTLVLRNVVGSVVIACSLHWSLADLPARRGDFLRNLYVPADGLVNPAADAHPCGSILLLYSARWIGHGRKPLARGGGRTGLDARRAVRAIALNVGFGEVTAYSSLYGDTEGAVLATNFALGIYVGPWPSARIRGGVCSWRSEPSKGGDRPAAGSLSSCDTCLPLSGAGSAGHRRAQARIRLWSTGGSQADRREGCHTDYNNNSSDRDVRDRVELRSHVRSRKDERTTLSSGTPRLGSHLPLPLITDGGSGGTPKDVAWDSDGDPTQEGRKESPAKDPLPHGTNAEGRRRCKGWRGVSTDADRVTYGDITTRADGRHDGDDDGDARHEHGQVCDGGIHGAGDDVGSGDDDSSSGSPLLPPPPAEAATIPEAIGGRGGTRRVRSAPCRIPRGQV